MASSPDPTGEYDWIVMDPAIDFAAMYRDYDTAVMGRKTYDVMAAMGGEQRRVDAWHRGRGLLEVARAGEAPGFRIVPDDPVKVVKALKKKPGKDIWLFGGGALFRTLLDAGLVDTVEIAVNPVLLGEGIPLLPPAVARDADASRITKVLPKSGIVALAYAVKGGVGRAPRIGYIKESKKAQHRGEPRRDTRISSRRTRRRAGARRVDGCFYDEGGYPLTRAAAHARISVAARRSRARPRVDHRARCVRGRTPRADARVQHGVRRLARVRGRLLRPSGAPQSGLGAMALATVRQACRQLGVRALLVETGPDRIPRAGYMSGPALRRTARVHDAGPLQGPFTRRSKARALTRGTTGVHEPRP
jgi:dihydrofolate reductase